MILGQTVVGDVKQSGYADDQVDGRANQGQAEVVPDAGVKLPALFDLLRPEYKQPGYDDQHAQPHQKLDEEMGDGNPGMSPLYKPSTAGMGLRGAAEKLSRAHKNIGNAKKAKHGTAR